MRVFSVKKKAINSCNLELATCHASKCMKIR